LRFDAAAEVLFSIYTTGIFLHDIMDFKSSPRHPGAQKTWVSSSPRPKIRKMREQGREKRDEELEEDQARLSTHFRSHSHQLWFLWAS
jgi:hypothetical protein